MKKFILILGLSCIFSLSYSQKIYEKEVHIPSKILLNGGDFVIVNKTLGYVTKVEGISIVYDFNTTPYTISGSDTLGIKTVTTNDTTFIAQFDDDFLEYSDKYLGYAEGANTGSFYSNDLLLSIPSNRFTLGDSDIYIRIKYSLVK